jgi:butyryl-CoA dehydrogenase
VLKSTTEKLLGAMMTENIDMALSNSVKYLELFGNVVIAWIWLKQGMVADKALAAKPHQADENFYRGKLQAMQYFFRFELPEIGAWAKLLNDLDTTSYDMKADWF